jgi:ATP-dependent helicase/nuclease subunit A
MSAQTPAFFLLNALDPETSAVVEASAGAGKTWLLVSRILRLLLAGHAPGSILAITFTRKAGQEMRHRLDTWVHVLATADDAAVDTFLRERGVPSVALASMRPRARALAAQLAQATPGMTVATFDSWFAHLTRSAPLDAPIQRGEIHAQTTRHSHLAWNRVLEDAKRQPTSPLAISVRTLLGTLGWWRLDQLVASAATQSLAWERWTAALPGAGDRATRASQALTRLLGAGHGSRADDITRASERLAPLFRVKDHAERGEAFAAAQDAWRRGDIEPLSAFVLTEKGDVREWLKRAALKYGLSQPMQQLVKCLPLEKAYRSSAQLLALQGHLYCVWDHWWQSHIRVKQEAGAIHFADLTANVLSLTADAHMAEALALKLDTRYRHVLIDELQDVNPAQWQIVMDWLRHTTPTETTFFGVGDPKQSIYGFRGSHVELFGRAVADVERHFAARLYTTATTRRLSGEVTRVVNAVFQERLRLPRFLPHMTLRASAGGVWLLPLVTSAPRPADAPLPLSEPRNPFTTARPLPKERVDAMEATQVARALIEVVAQLQIADESVGAASARRPVLWSDVLVLVRTKSVMPAFEEAFRRHAIPFRTVRRGGLLSTLEVQDMAALIRFLAARYDDLALAQVLRSPIFNASDAELLDLALQAQTLSQGLSEAVTFWEALSIPETTLAPALAQARRTLGTWLARADRTPPHDVISAIVEEAGLVERFIARAPAHLAGQVEGNIEALLELLLDIDGGRAPSLTRVAQELSALRELPDEEAPGEGDLGASDGEHVRIMTIHAAKGLEAPIVLLADTHRPAARMRPNQALVDWPVGEDRPVAFSWLLKSRPEGTTRDAWVDAQRSRELAEEQHLLYVAMTRAREWLIVSGAARRGADSEGHLSWYRAIAGIVPARADPPWAHATAGASVPHPAATVRILRPTVQSLAVGERRQPDTPTQAFGTAFHLLMESAARVQGLQRDELIARHADPQVAAAVAAVFSGSPAARFFSGEVLAARDEVEMLGEQGEILRPDRIVRMPEGWWILDYKTADMAAGIHPAMRAQLLAYRAALARALAGDEAIFMAIIDRAGGVHPVDQVAG